MKIHPPDTSTAPRITMPLSRRQPKSLKQLQKLLEEARSNCYPNGTLSAVSISGKKVSLLAPGWRFTDQCMALILHWCAHNKNIPLPPKTLDRRVGLQAVCDELLGYCIEAQRPVEFRTSVPRKPLTRAGEEVWNALHHERLSLRELSNKLKGHPNCATAMRKRVERINKTKGYEIKFDRKYYRPDAPPPD